MTAVLLSNANLLRLWGKVVYTRLGLLIVGFRMGFLGYLHVGITVDRLRQEYGSEVDASQGTT
jgi:translation elongation factor EF-4